MNARILAAALAGNLLAGAAHALTIAAAIPTLGGPVLSGIDTELTFQGGELDILSLDFTTLSITAGVDADGSPNGLVPPSELSLLDGDVFGTFVEAAFKTDLIRLLFTVTDDMTTDGWGDFVLVSLLVDFDPSDDLSQLPDFSSLPALALVDVEAVQAIPLPAGLALLTTALGGLGICSRRRR